MNQSKMSMMLKGIDLTIGFMGTVFLLWILPMLADEFRIMYVDAAYLYYPGICFFWGIGILGYIALYRFWRICVEIGRDNSFSKENIHSLNIISVLAVIAAILWFMGIVVLVVLEVIYVNLFVIMGLFSFVSICICVVSIVLAHLVEKAYLLKVENELTI